MKIEKVFPEELNEDKKFIYAALNKPDNVKMSMVESDVVISPRAFVLGYDEEKERNILSVYDGLQFYITVSETFINRFLECVNILESLDFSFCVTHHTNKSGRPYINFSMIYQ